MRTVDVITEKLHVLAVLEDGYPKDAGRVRFLLDEYFDLKPSKEAVRKHLERCLNRKLVTREKRGRSSQYRISHKGKEKLRRIRAKRQKQWEENHSRFAETSEIEGPRARATSTFSRTLLQALLSTSVIPPKQQETIFWIDVLMARMWRDEVEYVFYCFEQERKEKERFMKLYNEEKSKRQELEKENERLKLDRQPDVSGVFQLGRKIGKHETKMEQILNQQKLVSSLLQDRLSRKQKAEEAVHAIRLRRCINWRWWDLLPSSRSSTNY